MRRANGSRTFEMLSSSFELAQDSARCLELIGRRRTLVAAVGCNAQDQCTPFELAELALAAVAFAAITNTVQGHPQGQGVQRVDCGHHPLHGQTGTSNFGTLQGGP
jgi:hypothetical protein